MEMVPTWEDTEHFFIFISKMARSLINPLSTIEDWDTKRETRLWEYLVII